MRKIFVLNVFILSVLLSACDNTTLSSPLTFVPSSLNTCDKAFEVMVKWDVRNSYPGVDAIQITVVEGTKESIFADGGAYGEAKTGLWVRPGIPRFILKDKTNGKVLGEGIVNGPKCN